MLCTFGALPLRSLSCTELSTAWLGGCVLEHEPWAQGWYWLSWCGTGGLDKCLSSFTICAEGWHQRNQVLKWGQTWCYQMCSELESNKTSSWTTELGWITFWIKVKFNIMFYLWLYIWKLGLYKVKVGAFFPSQLTSVHVFARIDCDDCPVCSQRNCCQPFGWIFREVLRFFSFFFLLVCWIRLALGTQTSSLTGGSRLRL